MDEQDYDWTPLLGPSAPVFRGDELWFYYTGIRYRAQPKDAEKIGGAFVKTTAPLTPGHRLLVEFSLPDGSPMEAIGRVAWAKRIVGPNTGPEKCGIGIEFIAGASEQLESLDGYVQKLTDT